MPASAFDPASGRQGIGQVFDLSQQVGPGPDIEKVQRHQGIPQTQQMSMALVQSGHYESLVGILEFGLGPFESQNHRVGAYCKKFSVLYGKCGSLIDSGISGIKNTVVHYKIRFFFFFAAEKDNAGKN
jgi:hypothetical protein